ncbi:hypothetical protein H8D30_06420 [bacterium]|nr:hypothetical protein [bacterium]
MRNLSGWGANGFLFGRWGREATSRSLSEAALWAFRESEKEGVLLGHDGYRFMSSEIAEAIQERLVGQGIPVRGLERATTPPAIAQEVKRTKEVMGIAVTGAGERAGFVGIKLFGNMGHPMKLKMPPIEEREQPPPAREAVEPLVDRSDLGANLVAKVLTIAGKGRGRKIGLDLCHGSGRRLWKTLFHEEELVWFREEKRPMAMGFREERDFGQEIEKGGFSCGIRVEDGGERFTVWDEKGSEVPDAIVQSMVLQEVVKLKGAKGPLVRSVDTSSTIGQAAKEMGLSEVFTSTKEGNITDVTHQHHGVMAVKRGNWIYLPFGAPCGDAMSSIVLFLGHWGRTRGTLSTLVNETLRRLGRRYTSEVRLTLDTNEYLRVDHRLKEEPIMELANSPLSGVRDIEGIRTDYENGTWFWASPRKFGQIVLFLESPNEATLRRSEGELLKRLGL